MTDRVDLDALDVGDEEEDEGPRRGDWFWHGTSDPADEPTAEAPTAEAPATEASTGDGVANDGSTADATDADDARTDAGDEDGNGDGDSDSEAASGDGSATSARTRVPHVPRENEDKPVGIPVEGGGAGGTSARAAGVAGDETGAGNGEGSSSAPGHADTAAAASGTTAGTTAASGPHGSAPSAMTMAFSYSAIKCLSSPILVVANAGEWTDWIGVVGEVDAHVLNKFVREEGLDIDFFNGAGTGPAERLREISTNPNSMFSADRKVLVGLDADRAIADRTDWEFVPLAEAAEAAGWDLDEPTESAESDGSETSAESDESEE